MDKNILSFCNIEIEKNKFCRYKSPVRLKDVDIEKVLVSCKIFSGEENHKYFKGYFYHDHNVKHMILPKTSTYEQSKHVKYLCKQSLRTN